MKVARRLGVVGILFVAISCEPAAFPVPGRAYLHSDESPHRASLAYGYVILTAHPGPEEMPRIIAMCEAYLRNLEPLATLRLPPEEVFLTHWLLASPRGTRVDEECPALVQDYDYGRAARIATDVGTVGVLGPILVAYPPAGNDPDRQDILVLDLTDFSIDDIDRAFLIWKDRVSRDPSVWLNGFQFIVIRELFRNFIERYAPDILRVR